MAPKKGKKKQQDDDREADLGESLNAPSTTEAAAISSDTPPNNNDDDDDDIGGGLMSQLGKGRKVDRIEEHVSRMLTSFRARRRRNRLTTIGKQN